MMKQFDKSSLPKKRLRGSSPVAFALVALLVSTALAQSVVEPRYEELPNFHAVAEGKFYRGGQPKEGGLKRLASLGVKTIINLRDDDERATEEEREARALGLRYFNLPVSRAGRPSKERVAEVLSVIDSAENQPVFVHCKRGADRTGVVAAVYRVARQHWTTEQALEEADKYGMGFWQRGKRDFVRDYFRDEVAAPNGANSDKKVKHDKTRGADVPR